MTTHLQVGAQEREAVYSSKVLVTPQSSHGGLSKLSHPGRFALNASRGILGETRVIPGNPPEETFWLLVIWQQTRKKYECHDNEKNSSQLTVTIYSFQSF